MKIPHTHKPCPIADCRKTWVTIEGLFGHLYEHHNKAELVKCIIKNVEEEFKYYRVLKRESFR